MDPYDYGSSEWQTCTKCGTRRPPDKLIEAWETVLALTCNDGWCTKAEKLDRLLARVEAIREAKAAAEAELEAATATEVETSAIPT